MSALDNSWFIKGIGYLLLAVFFGIVLWIIHLRPKKTRKKRKKVVQKRKPAKKKGRK